MVFSNPDDTARNVNDEFTNPIRLVVNGNETGVNEGTIQIFYNGTWGTVCDDYWGFSEAEVACHMLGFADAIRAYSRFVTFSLIVLEVISA